MNSQNQNTTINIPPPKCINTGKKLVGLIPNIGSIPFIKCKINGLIDFNQPGAAELNIRAIRSDKGQIRKPETQPPLQPANTSENSNESNFQVFFRFSSSENEYTNDTEFV